MLDCGTVPPQIPVVAGTVSKIVVAPESEIEVTPPNIASIICQLGLRQAVPQEPGKSPVWGAIKFRLAVIGSDID
jgi:hypothetical protein